MTLAIGEAIAPPEDDLRSMLETQFNGADNGPEVVSGEPPEEVAGDIPAETEEQKADRLRDERGRFAKGDASVKAEDVKPEKAVSPSTDDPTKASAAQPSNAADAPPVGWTADAKAEWSTLSPALKAAVIKRETEIATGGRQWSEEKRRYEEIVSPVRQRAARLGISEQEGIQRLVAANDMLDRNPVQAIRWLAQSYGIDIASLTASGKADDSNSEQSPDLRALVRQELAPFLEPIQQRFVSEDQRQQQATTALVEDFAASPGHEHFNAVSEDIMAILPHVKAANPTWSSQQVLQESYDRAVYANPSTRNVLIAARDQDAEAKRQEAARKKAASARTAASSVTGSPSGSPAPAAKDSIRAEIEAAFAGDR
jgi:hypothetical protein